MENPLRKLKRFFGVIGPGVITGAADDDPSGIATYSQTGAQFGYGQLWSVLVMLPMMVAMQEVCARIGIVNGKGIAGVVKEYYPRSVLFGVVSLMLIANTINLGADLGAMAAATQLIIPIPFLALTALFAVISLALQIFISYHVYSRYLKWMSAFLFSYVLTGFVVGQDWPAVLRATLVPHIELSFPFLMILTGLLGTTISPYMFFWQASQEVEEEIEHGKLCPYNPMPKCGPIPQITLSDIRSMRLDTFLGMLFSEIAAWFIIITAAGSLHAAGINDISTAADAARALEPLVHSFPHSGEIAKVIFALGIVGLGLLAVPIFAASASYALSETFNWRDGLYFKLKEAPKFYAVMATATLIGMLINYLGINPMKALVYTAVLNGVIAVPLIFVILLVGSNRKIMGGLRERILDELRRLDHVRGDGPRRRIHVPGMGQIGNGVPAVPHGTSGRCFGCRAQRRRRSRQSYHCLGSKVAARVWRGLRQLPTKRLAILCLSHPQLVHFAQ